MAEEINDEFYSVPESEEENTLDSDEVLQAAKKAFGISYFFPWQRIVIANILDSANPGNDILKDDVCSNGRQIVLLPTGAGKSLCFLAVSNIVPSFWRAASSRDIPLFLPINAAILQSSSAS